MTCRKQNLSVIAAVVLSLCIAFAVDAATYSNVATPLAWIDPSSHTNATWTNGTGCPAPVDDDITAQLPIGFTFTYGSTDYTTLQIMSNGRLQFNNTYCSFGTATVGPPPTYPDGYPSANVVNTMRVYGADLDPGSGGTVRYASLGTAPNRYFVVTWTNVKEWTQAPSGFNLQIILYENGDFVYQYGSEVNPSGGKAQIGWELTTTDYTDYAFTSILTIANSAIRFYRPGNLAYYKMDETSWSGAAGEVIDSSGSGNNGVHVGAAQTILAGHDCRAEDVPSNASTATISAVDTGLDVDAEIGSAGTISFWYRSNTLWNTGGDRVLLDATSTANTNLFYALLRTNGTINFVIEKTGNTVINFSTPAQAFAAGTWVHVTVTWNFAGPRYQIYINGALSVANTSGSAGAIGNVDTLYLGDNRGTHIGTAGNTGSGNSANGRIDEVRIYNYVRTTGQILVDMNQAHLCPGPDHFTISHDGYGINCLATELVTVNVRDAANNPSITYNQQITLDTQTGRGTWTLVSGSGTFVDATANDGLATYLWPLGQSQAIFALDYRSAIPPATSPPGALTFDIDVYQTSNSLFRDDDTEGSMTFSPTGFIVTSSPLSNPPPAIIPAFASPQIAGSNVNVYITAYGQTPTDSQCGVIEGYTGPPKNIKFWWGYVNPATGTRSLTINGIVPSQTEIASSTQPVTFTDGQASVVAVYRDAGMLTLSLKDDTTGNPGLPNGIRGSTGNFVMRPSTFVLSNIRRTDNSVANPGAANATGAVFLPAGQAFSATVTALEFGGTATPNFGLETPAESVALTAAIFAPVGGVNPGIAAPTGFGAFSSGIANGSDFSWAEVGIITLTPHIKDGSYLGAGDFVGTTTSNIGRFIPNDFAVSATAPSFQTQCTLGAFTYIGQPFGYFAAPVLSVTARAVGGATTRNYTSSFFKITNTSLATLTGRVYAASSASLNTTGLPTSGDPNIQDLTNGLSTLTFSAGTGLSVTRALPVAPIANPQITLSQNVRDTDGVIASVNPVVIGSPAGIPFSSGAEQRYGRIAFRNAVGSEMLNLPLPMHAEYFASAASGFTQNFNDTCTTGVTLSFTNYGGNLGVGETCLLDTGSPGVSGLGCAVAGPVGQRFQMPPNAGDFIAILKAPGAGNGGTVKVTTSVPIWLQFDWDASIGGNESPSGVATFGIFQGESRRIFQSEK